MSLVMQEAVRRGYCRSNPCYKTGIRRTPRKEKPEITDAELVTIRAALPAFVAACPGREWMPIAFEIAIHQGCRLRETELNIARDVDFERNVVTFRAKGGKVFGTALHPDVRELILKLKAKGAKTTCHVPDLGSRDWWRFFKQNNLPHLCFHSTRVSVVTRMARAGVPIQQAMRYVGHASQTIHSVYQRLTTPDLAAAVAAVRT